MRMFLREDILQEIPVYIVDRSFAAPRGADFRDGQGYNL